MSSYPLVPPPVALALIWQAQHIVLSSWLDFLSCDDAGSHQIPRVSVKRYWSLSPHPGQLPYTGSSGKSIPFHPYMSPVPEKPVTLRNLCTRPGIPWLVIEGKLGGRTRVTCGKAKAAGLGEHEEIQKEEPVSLNELLYENDFFKRDFIFLEQF